MSLFGGKGNNQRMHVLWDGDISARTLTKTELVLRSPPLSPW
jgi:hypothetical protein